MNKLLKILLLIVVIFTAYFSISEARGLNELKSIKLSDDTAKDCNYTYWVEGCYINGEIQTIYIATNTKRLSYIFYHEIGHFLFDGTSVEEYNQLFNPFYSSSYVMPLVNIQEIAAIKFAIWAENPNSSLITDEMKAFFINKLR
jgi:hypothetical protein